MTKSNVKNIYDMAGNIYEWSLETWEVRYRTDRGGNYDTKYATSTYASYRHYREPSTSGGYYGSRMTLY